MRGVYRKGYFIPHSLTCQSFAQLPQNILGVSKKTDPAVTVIPAVSLKLYVTTMFLGVWEL